MDAKLLNSVKKNEVVRRLAPDYYSREKEKRLADKASKKAVRSLSAHLSNGFSLETAPSFGPEA